MKKKIGIVAITLLTLWFGCKKELYPSNETLPIKAKIENDPVFFEWGRAANGRWVTYTFEKLDKNSITKDNLFQILASSVKQVYKARQYYRDILLNKYGNEVTNFDGVLDSLYRKNYTKINSSLSKRIVMDSLNLQYNKLQSTNTNPFYGDLEEVVITACHIPENIVNFFNIYIGRNFLNMPPPGSDQPAVNCRDVALGKLNSAIQMLRYNYNQSIISGTPGFVDCGYYVAEAYDAMNDFYNGCDILGPPLLESPFDPYPPIGGGGGGGGTPGTPEYNPNAPDEVLDSVENPCIKLQLSRALTAGTTIRNMLNMTFTGTDYSSKDIIFKDVTNLPDDIMGTSHPQNLNYFDIALNKNKLPGMSQEYILATIYHEILHSYIEATYERDVLGQMIIPVGNGHNEMADNYIVLLIGALNIAFPNISYQEAWGLAWGGLEETSYFKFKLTTQEQAEVHRINSNSRKTASSADRLGTYCN